jgi:DNA polymerase gamma 1
LTLPTARKEKQVISILSKQHLYRLLNNEQSTVHSRDNQLILDLCEGRHDTKVQQSIMALADNVLNLEQSHWGSDPSLRQLDWSAPKPQKRKLTTKSDVSLNQTKPSPIYWPKWYWDLAKPKKDMPPGTLDITNRNRLTPLLLRLSWKGNPLFHSREHGWTFRVHPGSPSLEDDSIKRLNPLNFHDAADESLADMVLREGYMFFKLPHKDGDKANVGSPLAKTFMKFTADGTLSGKAGDNVQEIVDVGAQCSYWVSARDRILNQMVSWQKPGRYDMGFENPQASESDQKWGIILPQVLTMGTVTRRAIEKTWLTASNAKKNRVGSELKAMVKAPPGYAIVGADVDSEELWISSCMGDAQFGFHGATAIGWMTLEGTKSAGTDLHSKTASILGISRDQAKVFNYSRIYGAGMKHAVLLLLQGSSGMVPEEAQKLAENLYASTKGKNTHRTDVFERKFWFGGTESYLFNKLEEIALSTKPETPALGCGVTDALSGEYLPKDFGSDYMPSRINWVVQSSGVDYLHLLIVSMDCLIKKFDIKARYLISVHDELRYLAEEHDKYRAALALQVANLWTRSMFAYKLGMDDLPQGVAFFSAVDVDHVLRKEVDMPCVTPSHPTPIPPGESLDIQKILAKTNNGSLFKDGSSMPTDDYVYRGIPEGFIEPDCMTHRSKNAAFLRAQATNDFNEIKHLARQVYGKSFDESPKGSKRQNKKSKSKKTATLGNGDGVDWASAVEQLLQSGRDLHLM